ncbi:3-oxoadipate enol-lactonase [Actibacterium sp. 188UL27-1]|uniref:3-oxoadipate enol-lactonase n=1 Tax=Actibacterium sp. 188UL27-1 TaxID=2786961 RepID=UPI001956320D|nr:3-oxoadipate enol-lactonase [Actibacterium sp. 188UL27-1]MBM7066492.1 3-oxoadipate enol-lactonase [Actibacterium sp. 188UL27-1]
MKLAQFDDIALHYREDGDPDGAPLVFANSLGTDLRIWDQVVARLPGGLRIIRFDKRGHGLSDVPPAPYSMGALVGDTERLLDLLAVKDCVLVGLSIGGMIAQGLAVKRMDLMRGMVLSNTGAKIGTAEIWDQRVQGIRDGGIEGLADAVMERWFSDAFRATPDMRLWRNMLTSQADEGYIGCSQAISGTDFYTPTSGLRLPTLGIAGNEDGSTPPDMVRETAGLVPGSRFELIRGAGHIPCVEKPDEYAALLTGFLRDIGHI